jgi:transposase
VKKAKDFGIFKPDKTQNRRQKMKGWKMYSKIHQLKADGLKKSQVSRKLGLNYKTISKYWTMSPSEYQAYLEKTKTRKKKLDQYTDVILTLLNTHHDYTTSQIHDKLKERFPKECDAIVYSTLRRFVRNLRKTYNIPKKGPARQYEAIEDPPLGYQAQVDLGTDVVEDALGIKIRVFAIAMVLSHSRYKYIHWYDRPPTTRDFILFHEMAFNYYGGMPEEIVYDQDRLLIVSENFGDIVYTQAFESYRQQVKFKTYICRSADPESKGRVEAVVKYAKGNFSKYREFTTIEAFNAQSMAWLERTANAKVHATTKKIPAEVFSLECQYLRPVHQKIIINTSEPIITRKVHKDNTIHYRSNRYTLPTDTYERGKEVEVKIQADTLMIIDQQTQEQITQHPLHLGKGKLVKNTNHRRDHRKKIEELQQEVLEALGKSETARTFLETIRQEKPRYSRDQYLLVLRTIKKCTQSEIDIALNYCVDRGLYSATIFKSVVDNLDQLPQPRQVDTETPTVMDAGYDTQTQTRDIEEYERYAR